VGETTGLGLGETYGLGVGVPGNGLGVGVGVGEVTGGVTGKDALGKRLVLVLISNKLKGSTNIINDRTPRATFCFLVK